MVEVGAAVALAGVASAGGIDGVTIAFEAGRFDVDLAESKKMENPVYYVQYAHARIASLLKNAREKGVSWENATFDNITLPAEFDIIRSMAEFQEVIISVANEHKPQKLCNYAYSLSEKFHSYYNANKIVDVGNRRLSADRISLCIGIKNILETVLSLLGVSSPDSM